MHDTWNEWQTIVVRYGLYCLYLSLYDSYDGRHRWKHPTRMEFGVGGEALIACGFWKRKSFPLIMILLKGSPLWAHTSVTTRMSMNDKVCQCSSAFNRLIGAVLQLEQFELLELRICSSFNLSYINIISKMFHHY